MKKTCPYFVAQSGTFEGKPDFWGACGVKNISDNYATAQMIVRDYVTGQILKTIEISLPGNAGALLTNTGELAGFDGKRLTLELDGSEFIVMTPMNARRDSAVTLMQVLEKK